ncbi:MAG: hypothetical protein NVS1B10_00740 [Candidatus Saccharimonadales bacterium]
MKKMFERLTLSISAAILILIAPSAAIAAPASSPVATNGYRVSPVRSNIIVKPGNSTTVTTRIQNVSSAVENVQVIINDFEAPHNESGNPALLLSGDTAPQHSLKQFVSLDETNFTLQPNDQKTVTVTVKVPEGTAGGGYFGAVRFAPVGASGKKNVNLSGSVASLILLTVPGNLTEKVSLASFGVSQGSTTDTNTWFFSNKNLKSIVRFRNNGNIQEQPFGKVQFKQGATVLGTYDINNSETPGSVLPGSTRLFETKLSKVGWFGKYKVEGNFGYGTHGQLLSAQSTFYVIPLTIIILAGLVLILILFLIFGLPRAIHNYNRRVVDRTNRQN